MTDTRDFPWIQAWRRFFNEQGGCFPRRLLRAGYEPWHALWLVGLRAYLCASHTLKMSAQEQFLPFPVKTQKSP